MAHTETYESVIKLNTKQAREEIEKLERETAQLVKEQEKWERGSAKWKSFQKTIDKNNAKLTETRNRFESIDAALKNMSTAKPKELRDTIKRINELMARGDIKRGSKEWDELAEAAKRANTELAKIKTETKASQPLFGKFFKFLNDSWGGIFVLVQSITGITTTIRKSVEDYAKMEEEMADVRKYTGMTADQVRDMNEELKKMDTRTSREQLNQLAGAAGRLGLQSKKDILEFVEAADKIGVALGDDLGEGAVDNIGKLAMAFGEDEKRGLKGAMLSTGSALNELAQNSAAKAGFLVDFTARVAGFGKQLGLTQAQIMGFGTVMDENLLRDEMAATAFGNMLTKMQTDTAKFAKIAGKDMKEFTDLLNKDANAAILALADSLKAADPQTMMKMLDDMGLDGSRAVAVLATMADKIDDVRRHQERATRAYEEATSVEGEFNTMNNTVQAEIEKAKKRFHELSVELGEQLLPVVKYTITGGSLLVKALSAIAGVVTRNFGLISRLAILIGGYTAVVQIATNATKIWAVVTKATPWGLAAAGIAAVITVIDKYKTKMAEARQKAEELNDVEAKAVTQYSEEARKIKNLDKIMRDETISIGQRREALDRLKAIIPDYNGMLDEEGRLTRDNKKAIDDYLVSLEKQIRLKAYKDKLEELYKRQGEQEDAQREASDKYWNTRQANTLQGSRNSGAGKLMDFLGIGEEASLRRTLDKADRDLADTNAKIDSLQKRIADVGELADSQAEKAGDGGGGSSGGTSQYTSDASKKKAEADRKKQEEEERKRLKMAEDAAKAEADARIAAKTHEYATGKIAYRQYIQDMAALQREGLEKRRDVYEKGSREYEKLNRQIEELDFKGSQEVNRMKLEDLQRCMLRQRAEIEAQAVREEITESEKQERLRLLNEAFLADKVELYREGSKERMDAEWELEETEQRNMLERERQYQQQLDQVRQQYLGMSNEKMLQTALDGLDKLHEMGQIKEEEYQRALIAIRAQYAGTQSPSEQTRNTANDMLTNARNAAAPTESTSPIIGTIQNYQTLMEKLRELYGDDEKNHEAYLLAKQQATSDFCGKLSQEMQMAYQQVNQVMQAAGSYFSAQQEYETAQVQKKYDKQIEAAGNNQKKVKRLQEKQQKEEAAIKNKYNRRQMVVQMAQAGAQTAVNVIQAYGAGLSVGGVAAPIVAATFAAMALAAGMLQIATLKKQQQAQEAGYYEGGFTGGHRYRREAGVVHEGEFVANHQAVQNPAILPFLNFLDQAQRNNTVGSLTAQDVSRSMGAGGSAQVVAPIVNIQSDNAELREALDRSSQVSERLDETLKDGIGVIWDMDEFDRRKRHYDKNRNRG